MICLLGSQIVSDASSATSFGDALRIAVLGTVLSSSPSCTSKARSSCSPVRWSTVRLVTSAFASEQRASNSVISGPAAAASIDSVAEAKELAKKLQDLGPEAGTAHVGTGFEDDAALFRNRR